MSTVNNDERMTIEQRLAARAERAIPSSVLRSWSWPKTVPNAARKGEPSRNPDGRPRVDREVRELAQRQTPDLVRALTAHGLRLAEAGGGPDPSPSVMAAKLVLAYAVGQPPQSVQVTGKDGGPLGLQVAAVVAELE